MVLRLHLRSSPEGVQAPSSKLFKPYLHGTEKRSAQCCLVVQVDTKDILFICGGAFIDLDRQVAERTAQSSMGFGNPVRWALLSSPPCMLAHHHADDADPLCIVDVS